MSCHRAIAIYGMFLLLIGCSGGDNPANLAPPSPPAFGVSPGSFTFAAQQGRGNPATQTLTINNTGAETLSWTVISGAPWLTVTPGSGTNAGVITLTALTGTLTAATHTTTVTLSAPNATSVTIPVTFAITPMLITSLVQQAYVKASNSSASSTFGGVVALDAETMVVGAVGESTGALNSGAVYVLRRTGSSWVEEAFIKAPNIKGGEGFGASVALSRDTLVVGAPAIPKPGNFTGGTGTVYVFTRSGTIWSQQAVINASNAENLDEFGRSVALDGDTLVVGASGEDSAVQWVIAGSPDETATTNGALGSGAAYVFTRTNGVWTQQAYVKASNAGAGDGFGRSVALDGNTLVVGASLEDSSAKGINGNQGDDVGNAKDSGAVYVFTRESNTGDWTQQAYVKASNTDAGDSFGDRVALAGNILAVRATGEDSGLTGVVSGSPDEERTKNDATDSGAVYVFTRSGVTWSQSAYVKAADAKNGDLFGTSLALTDVVLAIGAAGKDSHRGAIYVFTKNRGVWSQQAAAIASNAEADDNFGGSLALIGNTMVVGAVGESSKAKGINGDGTDNSERASGATYVFTIE